MRHRLINLEAWLISHQHLSPMQWLGNFLEEVLLAQISQQKIVIFIDEIDSLLRLDFKDDFFAFIRGCYNRRGNNPKYKRLTFALLGVATPSDLIEDKIKSPFNIGKAIELHGFSLEEVSPLALGLARKVKNITAALKEVLAWTGGQPFLTQKLCKLIATSPSQIPQGNEAKCVDNLVRSFMIENWEAQDIPQHLKTIRDRILGSRDRTVGLLRLYQQILQKGEIAADDSREQIELRLSGLVVKQSNSLKVYNHIYEKVFNQIWVKRQMDAVHPYTEFVEAWLNFNRQDSYLLREQKLRDFQKWATGKSLGDEDYQFLNASLELERKTAQREKERVQQIASNQGIRAKRWRLTTGVVIALAIATLGGGSMIWQWQKSQLQWQKSQLQKSTSWQKSTSCPFGQIKLNDACSLVISSGESILFRSEGNFDLERGVHDFKLGNYDQAIKFFQKAVDSAPNNPEPQIYLNNANARQKGSPFMLAVVVPVDNNASSAKEMLRGVADAQTKFNNDGGLNGRSLEIVIANDGDNREVASKVAQQLANNPAVLGVIGHYSSEVSLAALPKYEKAGLAMVSSYSTSIFLKGRVFFRTVPSDKVAGEKLAQHIKDTLGLDKVVIFYDSQSIYSTSLREVLESVFTKLKGNVRRIVDLRNSDLNAKVEIERSVNQAQVGAAILLPSTQTTSVAISIAWANAQLPQQQRLKLLGGDTLYNPNTLIQGGSAVEGLTLAVAQFSRDTSYAQEAKERWKGDINWVTATTYDATQALIEAISSSTKGKKSVTRGTILNDLRYVDLPPNKTSGDRVRFFANGDPDREVHLVRVNRDCPSPQGSVYGFCQVNEQEQITPTPPNSTTVQGQ